MIDRRYNKPWVKREFIATFTFLDLLEGAIWLWTDEDDSVFRLGLGDAELSAKGIPRWDDGSRYNLCEWG